MIYLFAGGHSSLEKLNEDLDGLKVLINFGYEHCDDYDILIWGDEIVGHKLVEYYTRKPNAELVCLMRHEGRAKEWVDDTFGYTFGVFTIVWALMYLRNRFPNDDIIVYGLDGGGKDFYDNPITNTVKEEERARRVEICYKQLDEMPIDKSRIFNGNPNSPYKGFEFWTNLA